MRRALSFIFIVFGSVAVSLIAAMPSMAQLQSANQDPRQMAHDIYVGVNRGSPPATIALKLADVVRIFRFRCTRVTDYQVYVSRPNLIDLKVKCSGDPLYGLTVASNGYVAVYGGNGIVSSLDRRDAIIYSIDASGQLESDSRLSADQALDETVERLQLGDQYNLLYVLTMFAILAAAGILAVALWVRMWRKRDAKRRHRRKLKPLARHTVQASSSIKNILLEESEPIGTNLFKHPSGIFIAKGKRGKRRFFHSRLFAMLYRSFGIRMFETGAPAPLASPE